MLNDAQAQGLDDAGAASESIQASAIAPITPFVNSTGVTVAPSATAAQIQALDAAGQAAESYGTDPSIATALAQDAATATSNANTASATTVKGSNSSQVRSLATSNNNSTSTSEMFFAAKGTYYVVQYPTNSGKGIYAVEGLNRFNYLMDDAATSQQRAVQDDSLNDQQAALQNTVDTNFDSAIQSNQQQLQLGGEALIAGQGSQDTELSAQYEGQAAGLAQAALNAQLDLTNLQTQRQQLTQQRASQDAATAQNRKNQQSIPVLIMGIQVNQTDIVSAMACLGNLKVFYTMGQNFADMKVVGLVLLGPLGNGAVDGVGILNKFFNTYRVSISHRSITVSIATQAYEFFLTSMAIGDIDVEKHTLPFALTGIVVDPANGDLASINPAYTINTTLTNPDASSDLTTAAGATGFNVQTTASQNLLSLTNPTADQLNAESAPVSSLSATNPQISTTAALLQPSLNQNVINTSPTLPDYLVPNTVLGPVAPTAADTTVPSTPINPTTGLINSQNVFVGTPVPSTQ